MTRIGIVGCGNLGASLLQGINNSGIADQLIGSKRNLNPKQELHGDKSVQITTDNSFLINNSEVIILALKPYNIVPFLNQHKEELDSSRHTIVCAATGISIESMRGIVGDDISISRAMPNTAATIGESITLISHSNVNSDQKELIERIFKSIGETIEIDEELMDSATVLGACGIAYVLRFMRAMIQGGIEVGFDANTATKIVSQTMKGAAELVRKNGTHPEQEIDKVTTPKGCTIVGLNEMEHAGFSSALIKGIVASYNKIAD